MFLRWHTRKTLRKPPKKEKRFTRIAARTATVLKVEGTVLPLMVFLPKPRDFTRGLYKIRSTESGQLPTDQDLFDIITEGMPGSSMPPWETSLSADDRWEVVAYIKTFYDGFKESETSPRVISLEGKIPYSEESVEIGKGLYVDLGCVECHGDVGRGDGTSAPTLTDEWGFQTWPCESNAELELPRWC